MNICTAENDKYVPKLEISSLHFIWSAYISFLIDRDDILMSYNF